MNQTMEPGPGAEWELQGILPEKWWGKVAAVGTGIGVLLLVFAQSTFRPKPEITLTAQSVPLSTVDPQRAQLGSLTFLGGIALRSQSPAFGGISGLSAQLRYGQVTFVAVTDEGSRLAGRIVTSEGRLVGVDQASIEPLLNTDGAPIVFKSLGDAESLARRPDGGFFVGFEQQHRILSYGPGLTGPPRVLETPAALSRAPRNGGLESLASFSDGRLLAITERMTNASGNFVAFLLKNEGWVSLELKASEEGFEPSDATVLPDGDLLVLERFWSALQPTSPRSRIVLVKGESVKGGAVLQGELLAELKAPLTTENFEGITAFQGAAGKTQLLIVSDNNFNSVQRTLLLWFELP